MKTVRIIKNWEQDNLFRQTPKNKGVWGNYQFTLDKKKHCDYLLIINHPLKKSRVRCPKNNVWAINMEPPIEQFSKWQSELEKYSHVVTPDIEKSGNKYYHSQPATPWHVSRDFDVLSKYSPPLKQKNVSWITSNKNIFPGHKERMNFYNKLQTENFVDIFGRGISPIVDKWDGLENYQYSLAIENHSGKHYWTEKIADCFLAWTMPIYYGCTNLSDYFPKESYISIDINSPDAIETIHDAVQSNKWIRNRDAIAHSRELILNKYQLFPFITDLFDKEKVEKGNKQDYQPIILTFYPPNNLFEKISLKIKNILSKIINTHNN